ncbi:protein WHAT'S THIS FACTOR 9, mitochondrial [Euphorbia lathyris]|uniref:protein WHAT'S THIS FACTOR 9, mitochondrial n=1 Tax=Euphorbia lathyris TaxID=212925 RepID=UPI003313EE97
MQSLFQSLPKHCRGRRYQHHRGISDFPSVKHPRDRGLDHAVQREKHLKSLMNIKNLIKSEPTRSLPLSVIAQQKEPLKIPIRPIDFIRKYPSIFEEFFPAGITIHPHIKLTPQVLDIDADEQLVYQSQNYRQDVANRLLKLLMISRIDKIPLTVLDDIKWDLGLPEDYVKSMVPDFPDCFRAIGSKNLSSGLSSDLELELVCWSNELSTSLMEKKATSGKMGYKKGMPIAFPMKFTKGFEVDKQLKKWYDEWQKLPYISPFENMTHLGPNTDESDKWAVGILHELLSLFVSKKVEKDTLLNLGNWLGICPRLKRALIHHPGIFYLSSKGGTYTVVLREAYKRGLLNERSPMAKIRNQYAHLMNIMTEDSKKVGALGGSKQQEKKPSHESEDQREKDDDQNGTETNDKDSDFEYEDDDDNEEEEEGRIRTRAHGNARSSLSRTNRKNLNAKGSSVNGGRKSLVQKHYGKTKDKAPPRDFKRKEMSKENFHSSSRDRLTKSKTKLSTQKRTTTS